MTQEEIIKAFDNRWRIKADNRPEAWVKGVKDLCRDFFTAGILLSEDSVCCRTTTTTTLAPPPNKTIFEWWWDMYGKKIDRAKCEKKFEKLSLEEKQACIAATPAYVASTPDLQYRRHPMTYLNNKSWENQIIPHNNGNTQPTADQQRLDKLADILTE